MFIARFAHANRLAQSSEDSAMEATMKTALLAALTCLSLALVSQPADAAKKAAAPGKCTTGQSCAANCNAMGWCARMVCDGGKWQKRMVGCFGTFCGPKCS